MGLASRVNKTLTDSIIEIREKLQPRALLTFEGNEAALKLYQKSGYEDVNGEMTFLGDVCNVNVTEIEFQESQKDKVNKNVIYYFKGKPLIEILYSEEQFFSHPTNLDGKMTRIISISDLRGDVSLKTINLLLQQFLSEHRFCIFNVQELAEREKRLYEIFGVKDSDMEGLLKGFEKLDFKGINAQNLRIKRSLGIMEKDLSRDFAEFDQNKNIDISQK